MSAPLNGSPSLLSTFSTPLSRPPAAGPLCPPAGRSSENPRTNGQRTRLDRKDPSSCSPKTPQHSSLTDIRRNRSLKGNSLIAQGLPRSGYPGLGTFIIGLNPAGVRLRADRWNRSRQSICAHQKTFEISPRLIPAARLKPALSGLNRSGRRGTQGSAAHEPWAIQECPFRTSLGGTLLVRGPRNVT